MFLSTKEIKVRIVIGDHHRTWLYGSLKQTKNIFKILQAEGNISKGIKCDYSNMSYMFVLIVYVGSNYANLLKKAFFTSKYKNQN